MVPKVRGQMFLQAVSFLDVKEDAEDVVQEALAKLWQLHKQIDGVEKMKHLACVIVKNTSVNALRNRKNTVEIDDASAVPGANNSQETLDEKETRHQLMQAIAELPDTQRAVIRMRNVEQLSYKEIAQVLGTTESSVRAIICKARMTLMKQMKASI